MQVIYKPDTWRDDALLQPEPREAFAEILGQSWIDTLKSVYPEQVPFTFLSTSTLDVEDTGVDRESVAKKDRVTTRPFGPGFGRASAPKFPAHEEGPTRPEIKAMPGIAHQP